MICQVLDPLKWDRWPEAEALLEPARALGDFKSAIEPHEALLAVFDGDELIGAATVWHSLAGHFEIKLIGGRDHRKWIAELDEAIGAAARAAGVARLIAIGRRGWMRSIKRLGWVKLGEHEDMWVFAKEL